MKNSLYNQKGEKIGEIDLPKKVFEAKINLDLVHQAVCYYEVLNREVIAKTKDRSEVRGGGKKPWKQKGTGRARHGSIRSPIWKGGGATFGPNTEKKYESKFPKKMKKKSLYMVLSGKAKDGELIILDKIEFKKPKTKEMEDMFNDLSKIKKEIKDKKVIFAFKKKNDNFLKASSNIKNISTIPADSLNPYFLLKSKYLVMTSDAISIFS